MNKTNTTVKITNRAAIFDECVAEMSPQAQKDYQDLAKWIAASVNGVREGGQGLGLSGAKEIIIQLVRLQGNQT